MEKISPIKQPKLYKRILRLFIPHKTRIAVSLAAMLAVSGATAAAAYLLQPALDDIFINKNKDALLHIPMLFLVVMLAKGAAQFTQNFLMRYCGLKVLQDMRADVFDKVVRLPVSFFDERQTGDLISRIVYDIGQLQKTMPATIALISQVFTMVGLMGVVIYRDWFLAIFALLVLPIALYPFVHFGRKLRRLGRKNQVALADISTALMEIFGGIRTVKAFASEDKECKRFDKENDNLVRIVLRQSVYDYLSSPIMEMIGAVGVSLVIWYGGSEVIAGNSTPGTFFSFLAALIMMYDPAKKLTNNNNEIQKALAAAERVFEILDSPDIQEERGGDVEFQPPFESLVFQGVSFTYPGHETPVLREVDLEIKASERVAIVGSSGSGKTTLINLIPLFHRPQQGAILLNGRPITDYSLPSLRLSIGMVSQDSFLFNGTVLDNITYANENATMEEVEEVARMAYARDFIQKLPQGWRTMVGERGVKLSGGQKQRLTIARALIKSPSLLILDEATSALDTESERIVQLALENLMVGRTSIVIAHRLSTILGADKIVVLDQGRIVGQGRHPELLQTCPQYHTLYTMQFNDQDAGDGDQA